ncbi:MAG: hypothetical protein GY859_21155, partial [Desulfobacterales bacterium]|nr:hypothetical protein [Desulfobacterales bacterium]
VAPTENTVYTLTALGKGYPAADSVEITVMEREPVSVELSLEPDTILLGGASILRWNSVNSTSVFINEIGNVAPSGSMTVSPDATTLYRATSRGMGGRDSSEATLTVVPPPEVNISSTPMEIVKGENATIFWNTIHADSAFIDGVGPVPLEGEMAVSPAETTSYTITAVGYGGAIATSSVELIVHPAPAPPAVSIFATRLLIAKSEPTTLTWTTTDALSAEFDNGLGFVDLNGSITVFPTTS